MKEVVIATKNKHKIEEMKAILVPIGYQVFSLFDFDEFPDIIEDQDSFKGNAMKKAKELSLASLSQQLAYKSNEKFDEKQLSGILALHAFNYHKEINDNKLIKSVKNEYGKNKIKKEINFYEYIITRLCKIFQMMNKRSSLNIIYYRYVCM